MRPLKKTITNENAKSGAMLSGYIYKTLLYLRLIEHCRREDWRTLRDRVSGRLLWLCVWLRVEVTHIKSHRQNCPKSKVNNGGTMYMLKWVEKSPKVSAQTTYYKQLRKAPELNSRELQQVNYMTFYIITINKKKGCIVWAERFMYL